MSRSEPFRLNTLSIANITTKRNIAEGESKNMTTIYIVRHGQNEDNVN